MCMFEYVEVLVTIVVGGSDIDIALLVKMRKFIEVECIVGLCSTNWGGGH